jgi:hypothetical protein
MLPDGLRRTPALESNSFTIDENRLPSINDGACLWTLIAHPPYVITNALPCAMEIIVTQLPRHRSRQQSLRLPAGNFRDPALDLFFLPEVEIESARNSTCLDSPGSRISSPLSGTVTAWQGIVALGKEARVGSIVEGGQCWDLCVFSCVIYLNRKHVYNLQATLFMFEFAFQLANWAGNGRMLQLYLRESIAADSHSTKSPLRACHLLGQRLLALGLTT